MSRVGGVTRITRPKKPPAKQPIPIFRENQIDLVVDEPQASLQNIKTGVEEGEESVSIFLPSSFISFFSLACPSRPSRSGPVSDFFSFFFLSRCCSISRGVPFCYFSLLLRPSRISGLAGWLAGLSMPPGLASFPSYHDANDGLPP